ncbi:anthranilate synthase (plasmid) [Halostagnicola larsenii XH-48]|uniref:anthranilate synthase n=1 Tax=Halostagnicola larsenii XH-48 TaxID=797299 RepID=W0JY32_9EURY|nr:aminodeoxychorismate/anthranilate synthase component II [Halostagnicola larsenii]AHG02115.1 anthranilate synthase [Halostagnicola larsenii XH-48]
MILLIDNYDSFAYNLVQYVGEVISRSSSPITERDTTSSSVVVRRNDEVSLEDIRDLDPDGIIVSPGPGTPQDAGISMSIFADTEYPTLGVCLGHQALCATHGVSVGHAPEVIHGKRSTITHDGNGLFAGLQETIEVGRYHSLVAAESNLPDCLVPTARTDDDREVLMGVRHDEKPHFGVQFHPESILTGSGKRILENFVRQL